MQKEHMALIDRFVAALSGDKQTSKAAIDKIESDGVWLQVLVALTQAGRLTPEKSERFYGLWTSKGHRIREQVKDDGALLNVLRILLPRYDGPGLRLYRGENIDRWEQGVVGFAWTQREDIALMFAHQLNAVGKGGILLSTNAPVEAIIAAPSEHSKYLDEHEYVVDPRYLPDIVPIEQFPQGTI